MVFIQIMEKMLLNWLYQQIINMSKKSKRRRKFKKAKVPKITISIEVISQDGFKEEDNELATKE